MKWLRVKKNRPCPICERPDWCIIAPDGGAAICMRVESTRPRTLRDGSRGYLHSLKEVAAPSAPRQFLPDRGDEVNLDVASIMKRYVMDTRGQAFNAQAESLGVSPASLMRLCMAWSAKHDAWAFPMRDGAEKFCGIRLRSATGEKFCVRGSHNGLFIPDGITGEGPLVMPEGPTDTAAMLDLGFDAIGRPSCTGGVPMIRQWLLKNRRDVVIIADADDPGENGAFAAAEALAGVSKSMRVIFPLVGKDSREWLKRGATQAIVQTVIRNAKPIRKMRGAA